ncbi:transmembrane protein 208 [Brevipalpus obovatus]|uniref:transmembrane protein 208 n=1 Tax=Brevipalpus obovatus TaxID=246614 RepID=UPI003D9ED9F5
MMGPQKTEKKATKGQKKILEDNKSTIKFYTMLSSGSLGLYLLVMWLFFFDHLKFGTMLSAFISLIIYVSAISFMQFMAKPSYSESGSLIDGGIDLNMEAGMAEYAKDLVILTVICQCLSLISNYFLLLWLAAPFYASYLIWVSVLAPWFFAPAPEDGPVNEKKQRKMERRMRRMN